MPILRIEIPDELHQRIDLQKPEYLDRKGFVCLILDQALAGGARLIEPSRDRQPDERGEGSISTSSITSNKRTNTCFIKSLPPSLKCHEELVMTFWKTKAGSKSQAGWKLLMTELKKIQESYGDRVVRDQLELAAANRWKGVTLKNYEQFGLNKPQKQSGINWDLIEGMSI